MKQFFLDFFNKQQKQLNEEKKHIHTQTKDLKWKKKKKVKQNN